MAVASNCNVLQSSSTTLARKIWMSKTKDLFSCHFRYKVSDLNMTMDVSASLFIEVRGGELATS